MEATVSSEILTRAARVANALGTAWTSFTLYPNPTEQPAFRRALEVMNTPDVAGLVLEVAVRGFVVDGDDPPGLREAAQKLGQQMFAQDVEWVRLAPPVDGEGLITFFELLTESHDTLARMGGIGAAARGVPRLGLEVTDRGLLTYEGSHEDAGAVDDDADVDLEGVAMAAYLGVPPVELATTLCQDVDGDVDEAADEFVEAFDALTEVIRPRAEGVTGFLGGIDPDAADPWAALRSLVESFFYLPRPMQIRILEVVLGDLEHETHRVFLDQFSGLDLAEFLQELSPEARDALLAYAVASAGEREGAAGEVLVALKPEGDVRHERQAISARVGEVLGSVAEGVARESFEDVHAAFTRDDDVMALGVAVIRGLLECEQRPDRFARGARVWTARVARHLRDRDVGEAVAWLRAVLDDPPYPPEMSHHVDEALGRIAGVEVIQALSEGHFDLDDAAELIELLGSRITSQLVHQLAAEEDKGRRRVLTELLSIAASQNVTLIEPHLSDPRWFLVRNLATVLGKSGKKRAVPMLKRVLRHEDHRVRSEALRAAVTLLGDGAAEILVGATTDPNDRVRHTAVALLKSIGAASAIDLIQAGIRDESITDEAAIALVRVLGGLGQPGRDALKAIAKKRFWKKAAGRSIRAAAKEALR